MFKFLNSWVRHQINKLGYAVIPIWRMEQLPLSGTLRNLFAELDIRCVLDVGANKGQYRDFLRSQVDYQGLIISFEPIQKNAVILQDRAKRDNRWFTYPYALGSTNTNRTLNVMKSDEFSSFSTPDHSAVDAYRDMNVVDHEELVEIRRLDDVIGELDREHELGHIFLKMDTQGHDLEIFKGSKETLSRVLALQSEVSVKPIYASMPDYFTAIRTFTEAGFDVAGLFPVNTIEGRVIEFDCVMINKVAGRTSKFEKRSDSQGIE